MRFFAEISYNGAQYHGWQVQPNANTIQAEIEKAFGVLFRQVEFSCVGCGRTDTGVHASQFFLHFDLKEDFDKDVYAYKLNAILPRDIAIHRIFKVNEDAHARFDATSRTYEYFIHQQKNVFLQNASLYVPGELNVDLMNEACERLFDFKDFTSFSKLHTDVKTNLCEMMKAQWRVQNERLIFEIQANRFLRNMVRAIVGTMLEVGLGNITVDDFSKIIETKNRGAAGKSVPGYGLYLTKITYPYIEA